MYTYKVYDFDYDDTQEFMLQHKIKFSKEEYESIVNDCRIEVEKKINRNELILQKLENNECVLTDEEIEELELWTCSGEWHILQNIRKMMIDEYGFTELQKPLYVFTLHDGFYGKDKKIENRVID